MTTQAASADGSPFPVFDSTPADRPCVRPSLASRLPRLICSQNPFYLLSVCFVLHGTAHWFHRDNGVAFSPWPLLGLIAGYIILLATTGFVIVRFGKVWDDARSILLLILLLFVELSLIFDETLVRDPLNGRLLQLSGLVIAAGISELILCGLRIRLPWRFRVPYHLMLSLLFLYPLLLAPGSFPVSIDMTWRIALFPVVAAGVLLTLLPAIRKGPDYTRINGTPWVWPLYPWSLFVFLAVCIGFRAYALTLSFDPVLTTSLDSALKFDSIFGSYFLAPLVLAAGVLLLEIGLVSKRSGTIRTAMMAPVVSLYLALEDDFGSGPHYEFLHKLVQQIGSPLWLALMAAAVFYTVATIRRVSGAHVLLVLTLAVATKVGPSTIHFAELSRPQVWPLAFLAGLEIARGVFRRDSHYVFTGCVLATLSVHTALNLAHFSVPVDAGSSIALIIAATLVVGACYRDDFAWLLRIAGVPLLVASTVSGTVSSYWYADSLPAWTIPLFVVVMTLIPFAYAIVVRMRLYQLATLLSGSLGTLAALIEFVVHMVRDSSWKGATSFTVGLGWFAIAVIISAWKAGWLRSFVRSVGEMLTLEREHLPAPS